MASSKLAVQLDSLIVDMTFCPIDERYAPPFFSKPGGASTGFRELASLPSLLSVANCNASLPPLSLDWHQERVRLCLGHPKGPVPQPPLPPSLQRISN